MSSRSVLELISATAELSHVWGFVQVWRIEQSQQGAHTATVSSKVETCRSLFDMWWREELLLCQTISVCTLQLNMCPTTIMQNHSSFLLTSNSAPSLLYQHFLLWRMSLHSQPIYLFILLRALVNDTTFHFLEVTEKEMHLVTKRKRTKKIRVRGVFNYRDEGRCNKAEWDGKEQKTQKEKDWWKINTSNIILLNTSTVLSSNSTI